MRPKINVVWMLHRRPVLINAILKIFSLCDTSKFHLSIMGCEVPVRAHIDWKKLEREAKALGINATVMLVPRGKYDGSNYMKKIDLAKTLPYEYTIKYDEDVLMGPQAWNYLFQAVNMLDDKDLALFPALSNGIPTVDFFIEHNLNSNQRARIKTLMSNAKIPDGIWGVDVSGINDLLSNSGYDRTTFYAEVSKIRHHYKGINPIRSDWATQKYMNDVVIENFDMFFENRNFETKRIIKPYFCNSFFAIRTKRWKEALDDMSLYKDSFDEVPLNLYREREGLYNLVVVNTFAIHCQYNTLFCKWLYPDEKESVERRDWLRSYENDFWQEISDKLENRYG